MAVIIDVGGKRQLNASEYTVQEDATPINPADETGGTSQINFTLPKFDGWRSIDSESVVLTDGDQGVTAGLATAVSERNGVVQVSAQSRILQLGVERIAQPFQGTLGNAIRYYLSLVGIESHIVIDPSLDSIPVTFPGWQADVYQKIARGLCPAFSIEMSLVSDNIVFRLPRQRKAILRRLTDFGEQIDSGDRAQRSKLNWYGTQWVDSTLVYPTGGWNTDVEVFDVNAGQVKVYETVEVSASLSSIIQPTCVLNVGPSDSGASVYTVCGTDGLPIPPAMWKAYGGDLRVDINPDTRSLRVTIRGMDFAEYQPYSIAVSSGDGTMYSTLRVLGSGVILDPHVVDLGTGLNADQTSNEYSDEVDNDFLNDYQRAYAAASWQVAAASGTNQTLSFTAGGINRASDTGSAIYATVADWDNEFAGMTDEQWDAIWAGRPEEEWEEFWADELASDFANQAFGNVAGARIIHDGSIYRIRSASNSSGQITGSADIDNTVADFDRYYEGMTDEDFDALWSGQNVKDFDVAPFPDVRFDGSRPTPPAAPGSVFPGNGTFPSPVLFPG